MIISNDTTNTIAFLSVSLGMILSAVTTVSATVLIILRIFLVTGTSRVHYSYAKAIEILVQSAALEAIILISGGIFGITVYVQKSSHDGNTTFLLETVMAVSKSLNTNPK